MKTAGRHLLCLTCVGLLIVSCASAPKPEPETPRASSQELAPSTTPPPETETPKKAEDFVVTEELYQKTFTEVEKIVAALNRIIREKKYDEWVTYLTRDYIDKMSSPEYLAEVSNSAILKKNNIVLKDLKGYFSNVVVLSRSQVKLDKISFVDATHVKALTEIQGNSVILYWLVWEDGRWKIGIWESSGD